MPIKVEAPNLKPLVQRLESAARNVPTAFKRVSGTLRRGMATEASRSAVLVYNVGKQRLSKEWRVQVVDPTTFTLTGRHRPISLASYGARGTKKGLSVVVLREKGRQRIPSGFIATGRNGARLPFKRRGKARLPIAALYGPSPADILKNPKVLAPLSAQFGTRAAKELLRVIDSELAKRG